MNTIIYESLIILFLIVLNGFFAASEIAIISLKRSKTQELIKKGDRRAVVIDQLQKQPEDFLAMIQVGITVISTCASVFGGHLLVAKIVPVIERIPSAFVVENADNIALILVIIGISFLGVVIGELVPKTLAIYFAERIALAVSIPLKVFSFLALPFTKLLTASSNVLLAPLRKTNKFAQAEMTEEEFRYLVMEGKKSGAIEQREHRIIENLLDFSDRTVSKIMTPAGKIEALDSEESPSIFIHEVRKSQYSRLPVYRDQLDNIVGVVQVLEILKDKPTKEDFKLNEYIHPAIFMPTTQRLPDALQMLRKAKTHMAIIVDEHGGVAGLVTLEDILEEIVGDIKDEKDEPMQNIMEIEKDRYLVLGSTPITDVNRELNLSIPEEDNYTSISGFILEQLGRFPHEGEIIPYDNIELIVRTVSDKTIDQIELNKILDGEGEG